ncbi:hypothetical protein [Kocuria sp. LHG3120]|uniref:hypothetical protein n=1 Tax=Kocuria sp. LHG3120 TaxID=2804590 RepID=UPI003CEEA6A8
MGFWGTYITVAGAVIVGATQLKSHDEAQRQAAEVARKAEIASAAREKAVREERRRDRERVALQSLLRATEDLLKTYRSLVHEAQRNYSTVGGHQWRLTFQNAEWLNAADVVRNRASLWASETDVPHPDGAVEAAPPDGSFIYELEEIITTVQNNADMRLPMPSGHGRHSGKVRASYLLDCMMQQVRMLLPYASMETFERREALFRHANNLRSEITRSVAPSL